MIREHGGVRNGDVIPNHPLNCRLSSGSNATKTCCHLPKEAKDCHQSSRVDHDVLVPGSSLSEKARWHAVVRICCSPSPTNHACWRVYSQEGKKCINSQDR